MAAATCQHSAKTCRKSKATIFVKHCGMFFLIRVQPSNIIWPQVCMPSLSLSLSLLVFGGIIYCAHRRNGSSESKLPDMLKRKLSNFKLGLFIRPLARCCNDPQKKSSVQFPVASRAEICNGTTQVPDREWCHKKLYDEGSCSAFVYYAMLLHLINQHISTSTRNSSNLPLLPWQFLKSASVSTWRNTLFWYLQ